MRKAPAGEQGAYRAMRRSRSMIYDVIIVSNHRLTCLICEFDVPLYFLCNGSGADYVFIFFCVLEYVIIFPV